MIIMNPKKTNYLNLFALLEAEKHGYFAEQLEQQRSQVSRSGLKTEDYAREFAKVKAKTDQKKREDLSISLSDVIRKYFHGDDELPPE